MIKILLVHSRCDHQFPLLTPNLHKYNDFSLRDALKEANLMRLILTIFIVQSFQRCQADKQFWYNKKRKFEKNMHSEC